MPALPARSSTPNSRSPRLARCTRERAIVLFVAVVTSLLGVVETAPSHAQERAAPAVQVVDVMLVGAVGRDPTFPGRVTSWFDAGRFEVAVHAVDHLDRASVLSPNSTESVTVWVLLKDPHHARIYLASAVGSEQEPTYLLRDLVLEGGLDEMGAERVAQALHMSTVALLEGDAATRREDVERVLREETEERRQSDPRQGGQPEASSRSVGPPERAPLVDATPGGHSLESRTVARVVLGYGGSWRADEGIWHGPRGGLLVLTRRGWGAQARIDVALPTSRSLDGVELDFAGALLALLGSYQHALGDAAALEWSAGPAARIVRYAPTKSVDPLVTPGDSATEVRAGALVGLHGMVHQSKWDLALGAQCELSLVRSHYDVVTDRGRRVIGRSPAAVPSLGAEVRF